MTALTIGLVRQWRPASLESAAATVLRNSRGLDDASSRVARQVETAMGDWSGVTAGAAAERGAAEARTGRQLADALDLAHTALSHGATDIGHARDKLLDVVADAQAQGFVVGDDGSVTAPTLPPVATEVGDPHGAAASRNAAQERLNGRAKDIAADLVTALQAVADADQRTAAQLGAIDFPQSLRSAVESYIQRALESGDALGALGHDGEGAAALALSLKNAVKLFGKSSALAKFLSHASAPITDYPSLLSDMKAAEAALDQLRNGNPNGGPLRFLIGGDAAKGAGKLFLPLTALTGAADAVTGGGYDGVRGDITRGAGAAGAVGAGALLAGGAGVITLTPPGAAVAGGAVVVYGAWTAGNFVYDHADEIADVAGDAGGSLLDGLDDTKDIFVDTFTGQWLHGIHP